MLVSNSVGLCMFGIFACVIVSMPLMVVQGRSVRRHHRHHYSHPSYYYDFGDDLEYRDSYEAAAEKRGYLRDNLSRFPEHEKQMSSREYKGNLRDLVRQKTRNVDDIDVSSPARFPARRKRHNKHGGTVTYQVGLTEREKGILQRQHRRDLELEVTKHTRLELEVKEAQNRSICNYTVESIPDTRGSRVPRDLENVKCNHVGSDCLGAGNAYCCVQTYKYIDVSYGDSPHKERMKIYVGCVCANKAFNRVLQPLTESPLPIND